VSTTNAGSLRVMVEPKCQPNLVRIAMNSYVCILNAPLLSYLVDECKKTLMNRQRLLQRRGVPAKF